MSIEILPTAGYWAAAVFSVAGVGAALIVGTAVDFVARNHSIRVERQESIPAYYRGLVLSP